MVGQRAAALNTRMRIHTSIMERWGSQGVQHTASVGERKEEGEGRRQRGLM